MCVGGGGAVRGYNGSYINGSSMTAHISADLILVPEVVPLQLHGCVACVTSCLFLPAITAPYCQSRTYDHSQVLVLTSSISSPHSSLSADLHLLQLHCSASFSACPLPPFSATWPLTPYTLTLTLGSQVLLTSKSSPYYPLSAELQLHS